MSSSADIPSNILDAVAIIRELNRKSYLSRPERDEINQAKLRIAFWSCRNENIVPSRENLSYVLGADAQEIMGSYDRYLKRNEERAAAKKGRGRKAGKEDEFWKGT